ncbi:hypothetical protein D0T84_02545 [Dysgonomonas sp. 521]|uniref:hypothetical protein n=1 Tax=Dysgonomonas sp. 521 TaxID=2302932 RepID=UPI0013D74440|nr:hypothetical protein [Dysgonomonas sp. 521]NDV93796.1 hypothetical protein [Dysgonomonas sp. 521]
MAFIYYNFYLSLSTIIIIKTQKLNCEKNLMIEETIQNLLGDSLREGISTEEIETVELLLGVKLPSPLKYMYSKVGNDPLFMSSFLYFYPIEDLVLLDNKIQFLEENQDVCRWAFDIDDTDHPKVYQQADDEKWYLLDKMPLEKFLSDILYYQCAMGYDFGAEVLLERGRLFGILDSDWDKVVSFDGLYIYRKQDALIWYLSDDNMVRDVYYSSPNEETLNQHKQLFCLK